MDPVSDFYANYYSRLFSEKGMSSKFNAATHVKLEKKYSQFIKTDTTRHSILEIGAGKGEHLRFVKSPFKEYVCLDILPSPDSKFVELQEQSGFDKIRWVQADICDSNLNLQKFDRIISMCVLHHLNDPALAMENVKKCLKPGGTFSLFLPSDPGVLNRINRKFFVVPASKKIGFQKYELINAREHKNHYWGIKTELDYQFDGYQISKTYYPFGLPLGNLSLFSIWNIKSPS